MAQDAPKRRFLSLIFLVSHLQYILCFPHSFQDFLQINVSHILQDYEKSQE